MSVIVQVPLIELPGLLSPWVDRDHNLGSLNAAATFSRLFLSVLEAPSGGTVVGRLGTGAALGGSGISTTIADGELSGIATGSVSLTASDTLYFRLSTVTAPASDLSGWVEVIFDEASTPDDCAGEPVTVADAKAYLRVDTTTDDALICALIHCARLASESYLGRPILEATRTVYFDRFPGVRDEWWDGVREASIGSVRSAPAYLDLRVGEITSVASVKGYDDADAATTLSASAYYVDTRRGRIYLRSGQVWPAATRVADAVEVVYTLGYASAATVPPAIKRALLVVVGALYEYRESPTFPEAAKALLQPYRVLRLA